MSPMAALMLLGENSIVPFVPPTVITWTVWAMALPMLKTERVRVMICILMVWRLKVMIVKGRLARGS